MSDVNRRSKKSSPVYGKVIGGRHLTLPINGPAKLVVTTKTCSCCNESLALSKFYPESESKGGGLRNLCRDCWDETNGRIRFSEEDNSRLPEEYFAESNLAA